MNALYNEIEPFACDWLDQIIEHGHIAPGRVERRSITDLRPADVAGPGQRHFFAGIGGWSYALRLAGVPDDASIWTGSCPCQPFSQAGRRGGTSDPRHLWPAWFALIRECRPPIVFGEQVAGPDGLAWLDGVFADMEGCGYACGAAVVSAGGVSAPHARHRLYFVAYADKAGFGELGVDRVRQDGNTQPWDDADGCGASGGVGDSNGNTAEHNRGTGERAQSRIRSTTGDASEIGSVANSDGIARGQGCALTRGRNSRGGEESWSGSGCGGVPGTVGDSDSEREGSLVRVSRRAEPEPEGGVGRLGNPNRLSSGRYTGAVSRTQAQDASVRSRVDGSRAASLVMDPWRDCQWVGCADGKRRPIPTQSTLFPLASGVPNRVGLLRGSGNAIVPQAAAIFIRAALEAKGAVK